MIISQHALYRDDLISDPHLLENLEGSGLNRDNGLPRGVHRVYDRCPSTGVVKRHRRESTFCGGRVIPKHRTTFIGLHVVGLSNTFDASCR